MRSAAGLTVLIIPCSSIVRIPVHRGFDDCPQSLLAFEQEVFGAFALDKLSKLAADIADHLQEIAVRFTDLPAETFDRAQGDFSEFDREPKRAMNSGFAGDRGAAEIIVRGISVVHAGFPLRQTRPGKPVPERI